MVPYSQNDMDSGEFCYDDKTEKTGFTQAIAAFNGPLSTFFKGKELYITKKTSYMVEDWLSRKKDDLIHERKQHIN